MPEKIKIAELFAGVGGFRLGLDGFDEEPFVMPAAGPFQTVWANQWEPPGKDSKQFAAHCYQRRFGVESVVNCDIAEVLDAAESGSCNIPDVDMVVGGFPCQDYSVAKPLSKSGGIEGKKGVLWWEIHRFLEAKRPKLVLLENVDRLLKSPASQRGRDFAIILSCLSNLGYSVEWRVVNSADYGFSQRRKRIFIFAELDAPIWNLTGRLESGIFASAFPIGSIGKVTMLGISSDPYDITNNFNKPGGVYGKDAPDSPKGVGKSPFEEAGCMQGLKVVTAKVEPAYSGNSETLGDVVSRTESVPESYYIPSEQLGRWEYLKGSKSEQRVNKSTGFKYRYSEGQMSFPDSLDKPSRTILTGEGGSGPSRFKHVVLDESGRQRRLLPEELELLQGFPAGWTDTGMTDTQRAFCMGNALVVGVVHRIGKEIARRYADRT